MFLLQKRQDWIHFAIALKIYNNSFCIASCNPFMQSQFNKISTER